MKILTGKIVSTKMQSTVIVEVTRQFIHPLYKKIVKKSKRIKAHTDNPDIKVGDLVKISQTRPLSKEKHYRVLK